LNEAYSFKQWYPNVKAGFSKFCEIRSRNCISAKIIGGQNKFSSPPTPFETRGGNVTVCPANMFCYHSGTFSVTEMLLSAYCTL
jgi:hypothetical protein